MNQKPDRPLSPHLLHWKWEIHAITSIFHRITGDGMALLGLPILVWWLYALSAGPNAYEVFFESMSSPIGQLILVGLSFAFFQHLASGLRHFIMDIGAGYDVKVARKTSFATFAFSVAMTSLFWMYLWLWK